MSFWDIANALGAVVLDPQGGLVEDALEFILLYRKRLHRLQPQEPGLGSEHPPPLHDAGHECPNAEDSMNHTPQA